MSSIFMGFSSRFQIRPPIVSRPNRLLLFMLRIAMPSLPRLQLRRLSERFTVEKNGQLFVYSGHIAPDKITIVTKLMSSNDLVSELRTRREIQIAFMSCCIAHKMLRTVHTRFFMLSYLNLGKIILTFDED